MITCKKCHTEKEDSFFRLKKNSKGIRKPYHWCKQCELKYNNQRFKNKRLKNKPAAVKNLEGEIWKGVPNYDGYYEASNKGRIKSIERRINISGNIPNQMIWEKLLRPCNDRDGYEKVVLAKQGVKNQYSVHRLVLMSFIGIKKDLHVNHIDGVKNNNLLENLEYVTPKQNAYHSLYVLGKMPPKGEACKNSKLIEVHSPIGDIFYINGGREVSRRLGLGYSSINHVLTGRIPLYKGYYFKYVA